MKDFKTFVLMAVILISGIPIYAQYNQTCAYTEFVGLREVFSNCLSEYETVFEVPEKDGKKSQATRWSFLKDEVTDTVLNNRVDALLGNLGLSRNFGIIICRDDSIGHALVNNEKQTGFANRELLTRPHTKRFINSSDKSPVESLTFFHAVGHHILRHFFIKGMSFPEFELEADRFAGFAISRQSEAREIFVDAMRELMVSEDSPGNFPPIDARLESFKIGWEQGLTKMTFPKGETIPIFTFEPEKVNYFWEGAKKADSLKDHETALRYYLNAYSYSGGKNRFVLGEAFKQARKTQDPDLAISIGLEMLKCGFDLKNMVAYKNLLLELSAYYQQISDPDRAMQLLEISRKGDEYRTADLFAESRMFFKMGRLEESRESLIEAIRLGPATSEMYNLLGSISMEMGDLQAAIRAYRRVLAKTPDDLDAIMGLASVYAREALSMEELEKQERNREERSRLATTKYNLFRQAEEVLQAGLAERPGDEDIMVQLLRIYVLIPDEKSARNVRRALKHAD